LVHCEFTADDEPCEFVTVAWTAVTAAPVPWVTAKGTVSLNWPPVAFDVVFEYQVAAAAVTGTVISACEMVFPLLTVKWNKPLENSRVLEYPVTI
jgi:hypothetical protein